MELRAFALAQTLARGLTHLLTAICVAIFAAATAGLSAEIVMRYVFDQPLSMVHEACTIGFVYAFLLGAAVVHAYQQEVAIDIFYEQLGRRARLVLMLLIHLAILVTALVLVAKGWQLAERQMRAVTPSLNLPRSVYGMAVVTAFGSFALFSAVEIWGLILSLRRGGDWSVWPRKSAQEVYDLL